MERGLIQVYTGDGKGKTTASIGLGIRAVGRGFKVYMVQFLKGADTGELHTLKNIENFKVFRFQSTNKFFWTLTEEEKKILAEDMKKAYDFVVEVLKNKKCDVLILDEIMAAIHSKMYTVEDVLKLIDMKPKEMELVLTGRSAPQEIIERADLVTEMKAIKHPFEKGIPARYGIEY
ncbi:ATP:corrinoid adenosyltransferase BtuR/CobO/CobP [Thermoanaerobacter mathranii subsp. mathranii str. A3]|uniref:ATP:corrinoid adenosyltransferase BtuR/CobO/CobP n=1 Tax=Thermoanaerobacter mathranii subsp. mathranii (strain DSM 11426 / CCUG 53645 / CIP 108742 / A3) TaxID=583358 RepID=A0ABN3Z0Y7_THEM3|nr:cob(I)yrinic acid a,c-diamide adenosyltransferase [Thermoanaerobacter mathranii]ADH60550.1 ATP:corrinoid adenosyltransferase BtuR/CobO/CobP [Thermoanaerobacter mathranii subsp. mathranii str. A3]MDK2815187.1 cob(I)alamin adenosyltransferase [Thermoanaerobacter sp.]